MMYTEHLQKLIYDYGLLHITVVHLEAARQKWGEVLRVVDTGSLRASGEEESEHILVVRISESDSTALLTREKEHGLQVTNQEAGRLVDKVSVLELPEDEFHVFRAFQDGTRELAKELPDFFYGMCLIHAHSLFERYLTDLLNTVLLACPKMLGRSKSLNYGEILESFPSVDTLLETMIQKELRDVFYQSWVDILNSLRAGYGLKELPATYDEKIVEWSLVRNCLVHNRGIADVRLERETGGVYKRGDPLDIDREAVFEAMSTYKGFSVLVDETARAKFLKK